MCGRNILLVAVCTPGCVHKFPDKLLNPLPKYKRTQTKEPGQLALCSIVRALIYLGRAFKVATSIVKDVALGFYLIIILIILFKMK